jgi:hypothetical protein
MTRSTPPIPRTRARVTLSAAAAALAVLAVLTCGGCRSQDQPAPVTSPQQTSRTREKLQAENPNALIGEVTDVLPESQLCAVGNVDVSKFRVGDTLVFYTTEPLATGHVLRIVNDQLHVRFEPYGSHGRAPHRGDLAVHLPEAPFPQ